MSKRWQCLMHCYEYVAHWNNINKQKSKQLARNLSQCHFPQENLIRMALGSISGTCLETSTANRLRVGMF